MLKPPQQNQQISPIPIWRSSIFIQRSEKFGGSAITLPTRKGLFINIVPPPEGKEVNLQPREVSIFKRDER